MGETVSVEVSVARFGIWRTAVAVVAAIALACLGAWSVAMLGSVSPERIAWVGAAGALLAGATLVIAGSLMHVRAGALSRHDGQWRFAPIGGVPRVGALVVALDLGSFLLLRLDEPRHRPIWLPMQRRGLERELHALRCAVYSPPPAAAESAESAAAPLHPRR
jgi:hypothetical protein